MVGLWNRYVKPFFYDEATATQYLKFVTYGLAVGMVSGIIPLGEYGWYGGLAMFVAKDFLRNADPRVSEMQSQLAALKAQVVKP